VSDGRGSPTVSKLRPVSDVTAEAPVAVADPASASPEPFRLAVTSLGEARVRPEVRIEPIRAPQRLAPWTYAVSADVIDSAGEELASGRLVLLYDPNGAEAWDGELRLVAFASAEVEHDIANDPMLPEVAWSWLTSSLTERSADFLAAGGTVTQTSSTRFGDVHGPQTTVSLELRGSWTARTPQLGPHLLGFVDLLCSAAGLPPEGVSVLHTS
jgi:hypothetical protein